VLSRKLIKKQPGRRPITALAVLGLLGGMMLGGSTALAVHDEELFELDTSSSAAICAPLPAPCGDANVADGAAPGDDWATINAGGGAAFASSFIADPVSSAENSFYTGGGSKDVRDVPAWLYGTTNDVIPDKDDIADAFVSAYNTGGATPETIIYFGIDRYDNNGDAETGFWFFQEEVSLGANGQFNGTHTIGDVLVLANWGGSNPVGEITVYQWVGGKNPLALVADNLAADCATVGGNDDVCAVVNRQVVDPPWAFTDKSGSQNIRPLELLEAGINLTQLFGGDICFGSFLASTRSSHSPTAQLKDFALGPFEQCGAAISIGPDATNEVGDEHTFTVSVTENTGSSSGPAAGVVVDVDLTADDGAAVDLISDTCASPGTDADGECEVTFTSDTAGTVTGHASATVTIGDDDFLVETDGVAPNSDDAVKTFVDARISVGPSDVNAVGDQHTFTVLVEENAGSGSWAPASGEAVTITFPGGAPGTVNATDCAATDSDGQCDVIVNSSAAGTFAIHAASNVQVGGLSVSRETDGIGDNSGNATKRFVDAYIVINPPVDTNTIGDPHTFTVTLFQDDGIPVGGAGGDAATGFTPALVGNVDVTLTNDATSNYVIDLAASTCDNNQPTGDNLDASGQCTIVFTSNTAGTITGNATGAVTLGGVALTRTTNSQAPNSGPAIKHFVAGSIAWTKVDNAGALQGGATFEVCKTHNFTLPSGPMVDLVPDQCVTVADNGALDADAANGKFRLVGLSLGTYTVRETIAPAGFVADPDTVTVELTPGDTDKTIATAFVNTREVLKITGFGYTNSPTGTPTSGVTSGTTTFTVNLHNYGSATANLTNSSLVVSVVKSAGTVICNGTGTDGLTRAITGTIAAAATGGPYVLVCTYTNLNDGATITADLVVKSTTNTLEREASGSPARIRLTIQAD
jgi:hypothetical protein